jgi:hypothetical protein
LNFSLFQKFIVINDNRQFKDVLNIQNPLLSTTLNKFDKKCGTLKTKMKKNSPLLSTMFKNRFEGSCGTFGEGKKNPLSPMTLGQFAPKSKK